MNWRCVVATNERSSVKGATPSPEDALVIVEVLRRVRNAVGDCPVRADGTLNQRDFYDALDEQFKLSEKEAYPDA